MNPDVVIVGAGPAGSATALLLARRGRSVTVVDKATFPRTKPCGEYLNPAAVSALDRMGMLSLVAPLGVTLSGMLLSGWGVSTWAPFSSGRGLLVPRDRLDHALLRAAAQEGAAVIEGFRVDAVRPGVQPSVTGRRGAEPLRLSARVIIGADGLRSIVARHAGPAPAAPGGHYTVGAHFDGVETDGPRGDLHLGSGWYAGAAHYGGGAANVVAAVPREAFRRTRGDSEAVFAEATAGLPSLAAAMHRARQSTPFVTVGPLGYIRRQSVSDGLLLVGDASAAINPMTGEGLAMALRGAELAADAADRALRETRVERRHLMPYEHARSAAFRDTWYASRFLQWIVRRPGLARALFRRIAVDPILAARLVGIVSGGGRGRDLLAPEFLTRLAMAHGMRG